MLTLIMSIDAKMFCDRVSAEETQNNKQNKNFDSEKKNFLYGYDVTSGKNLLEPGALNTNAPIIDESLDYLEKHVIYHDGFKQDSENIVKYSLKDASEAYGQKISAGIYGRIFTVDAEISGEFDLSSRIENCKSEKYEMYTTWITNHYFDVDLKPNQIKEYLNPEFKKDLYAVNSKEDANALFNTYGTHLNTGYMFGGRLNVTQYMSTDDATHSLSKAISLSQKINVAISRVSAGESASISEEYTSLENEKSVKSSYKFTSYGGRAISSLTVDDLFTYNQSYFDINKSGFMYTIWINSINDMENLSIVGIPDSAYSLKLWELLDYSNDRSSQIRDYLIDAYIDRCGDKYNEYIEGLDSVQHEISPDEIDDYSVSSFEGMYIRTPNRYYYYIDKKDLERNEAHYGIHNNERIYLCFDEKDIITYKYLNCEPIDTAKNIFKVNGTSGNVVIKIVKDGKEKELINLPIKTSDFEGGMGNEKYPYIITNLAQFRKIASDMKGCYLLCSDINFGGEELSCLGEFEGQLDGNYCTISNFIIEKTDKAGLFRTNQGTIKNLGIKNAGSSIDYQGFIEGGVNYDEDCKEDKYVTKSVSSECVGLICAENLENGCIEGCYAENVFIRNVIKNNDNYIFNSKANVSVGSLVGVNEGEINDCMVKNSCILNSFVFLEEKKNFDCSVISGGIVGRLNGGSIRSCVVDMGTIGTTVSQALMWYDLGFGTATADVVINSFAGGFIGYCDADASISNCFVSVRNETGSGEYRSIDALYKNNNKMWYSDAKEYHALRCGSMVCGENCKISSNKNWITCGDGLLQIYAIRPTDNGDNREKKGNDNFERIQGVFIEGDVKSEPKFETLGLTKKYFSFNSRISGVSHILSQNRSSYLSISEEVSETGMDLFVGQKYSPENINLIMKINGQEDSVRIFKYNIKNLRGTNVTDNSLFSLGEKQYFIIYSLFDDDVTTRNIPINIIDSTLFALVVEDDDMDGKQEIYLDETGDFKSNPFEFVKIKGVLSNGEIKDISTIVENYKKYFTYEGMDKLVSGDNLIKFKYNHGKENIEVQTILHVTERIPKGLTILNKSDIEKRIDEEKSKLKEGSKISESGILDDIHIKVEFTNSEPIELSGKKALQRLEIAGDILSKGDNHIVLSYGNYDAKDSVNILKVTESAYDEQDTPLHTTETPEPTNEMTPSPEPTPTNIISPTVESTPTVDPTITPTETPTPTPKTDFPPTPPEKSYWWIWLLCILVVFVLAFFGKKCVLPYIKEKRINDKKNIAINDNVSEDISSKEDTNGNFDIDDKKET